MTLKTLQRFELTAHVSGWQGGKGPALMLVHGVGLRAEAWFPMIPFLQTRFSLTVIDLPGHGASPLFRKKPQLVDYTNTLADVLKKIGAPAVVVGHSMGALITMDLAIRYPELVSTIVPLNAIYRRSQEAKAAVVKRASEIRSKGLSDPSPTLERWFGDRPEGELKMANDACRQWLTTVDAAGYAQAYSVFASEDGPSGDDLASIHCPALFMTGSKEPNSTPEMSLALARGVARGKAVVIDGARHMMPMTHAGIVSEHLASFIQFPEFPHG